MRRRTNSSGGVGGGGVVAWLRFVCRQPEAHQYSRAEILKSINLLDSNEERILTGSYYDE